MAKEQPIDERLDEIREDDGQIYVERDKVDFDPDEGLLSGTAIDGTSEISDDPDEVAAAEKSDGEPAQGGDAAEDGSGKAAESQDDSGDSGDTHDTDDTDHSDESAE